VKSEMLKSSAKRFLVRGKLTQLVSSFIVIRKRGTLTLLLGERRFGWVGEMSIGLEFEQLGTCHRGKIEEVWVNCLGGQYRIIW